MRPPASSPSKVSSVLRNVLQRVDPDQQLRAYDIWTFWDDEVGEGIARRAQPARFRNGILFVTVATHSWMQELQYLKDSIRERLNTRLGAKLVRDIYFVSGSVERAVSTTPATPTTPRDVTPLARVDLPPLADPTLAAAFERVITAATRRRPTS